MKLLDGKKIAEQKLKAVRQKIVDTQKEPALAVILIGDDSASELYVKLKEKAAKKVGIELRRYLFDADVSVEIVKASIDFLNADADTQGIIVQLPLPTHLDPDVVVNMIDPAKDVDGFHRDNQEKFLADEELVYPVFPGAIMTLIQDVQEDLSGMSAVVVGKSDVFDRVMTHALARGGAQTKFIQMHDDHDFSAAQTAHIKNADIVISALGRPEFFSGGDFKDHAIVIDGGISRLNDRTVGDVDQKTCVATNITLSPVPGGVGPVTIACLLSNL